jgi:hypothetical protein
MCKGPNKNVMNHEPHAMWEHTSKAAKEEENTLPPLTEERGVRGLNIRIEYGN